MRVNDTSARYDVDIMALNYLHLLKAFPMPDFIPEIFTTVKHVPTGRRALVVSMSYDPDTFDINAMAASGQLTRPHLCMILLGEDEIEVDVATLECIPLPHDACVLT